MRIALTTRFCNYVADGCEAVFTPKVWHITLDAQERNTLSWELTDEGYDLADQYRDDASHGYDLCFGRAKGLAQKYTEMQMLMKIITDPRYVTNPEADDYNIYEDIECTTLYTYDVHYKIFDMEGKLVNCTTGGCNSLEQAKESAEYTKKWTSNFAHEFGYTISKNVHDYSPRYEEDAV